ncbi:MAG: hypothetical protein AB1601_06830 [Planctomycetota bacterium]
MHRWWRWVVAAGGVTLFLGGCDPTLRTTVENGIINVSTSVFGAILRALIELGQEAQSGTTARAIIDVAEHLVA